MRAPDFWFESKPGLLATLLSPLGWAYGAIVRARLRSTASEGVGVPVICIGNVVLGGAGKTPVALDIGGRMAAAGRTPHFLTRGYGGRLAGPVRVDPAVHGAVDVGDEPLLLARMAPTWVAKDRVSGAKAAVRDGASHIVMDDGFQNPNLRKDLSILVVDGEAGFGNGGIFPAGPLREPVSAALRRADAIVVMAAGDPFHEHGIPAIPVLRGCLIGTLPPELEHGGECVAFAGIGRPEKFFATIEGLGLKILQKQAYPDHCSYSRNEIERLIRDAEGVGAALVTTEKDWVRVPKSLRRKVTAIPVAMAWDDPKRLTTLLP